MYKTPTFAEPQQYNRPFSTGQLSACIIQLVLWDVATPQVKSDRIRLRRKSYICNVQGLHVTSVIRFVPELFLWIQGTLCISYFSLYS